MHDEPARRRVLPAVVMPNIHWRQHDVVGRGIIAKELHAVAESRVFERAVRGETVRRKEFLADVHRIGGESTKPAREEHTLTGPSAREKATSESGGADKGSNRQK